MGKLFLFYQYTIIKLYSVVTENKETARKIKKKILWNDLYYFGKNCLRGVYHKLITVLVVCNLDGTMSRLAAKCRAETVEKKLYSADFQSKAIENS